MTAPQHVTAPHHLAIREKWLARGREAALAPALPIVDPHHHFWDRPGARYGLHELAADIAGSGHRIVATVFVQARSMHRADGPEPLRPVGETAYVAGLAAMNDSGEYGPTRVAAGIVGYADLLAGEAVRPVLEAHVAAAGGRFRGARHSVCWDADTTLNTPKYAVRPGMLADAAFRAGAAQLANLGLSFEAWAYHPQLAEVAAFARALPALVIVLDHVGGPLGAGAYAGHRDTAFADWCAGMAAVAACPNVVVKLGGLGMRINGMGFERGAAPPDSTTLAAAWRPWIDTTIGLFGADRCMFESNFPVDKGSYGYGEFWNACKRLAAGASDAERQALFRGTASRVYAI